MANLADGSETSEHLVQTCLDAIDTRDAELGAFLEVWPEEAMAQARSIDQQRREGHTLGPLAGVPIALKDNIHIFLLSSKEVSCIRGTRSKVVVKHLSNSLGACKGIQRPITVVPGSAEVEKQRYHA